MFVYTFLLHKKYYYKKAALEEIVESFKQNPLKEKKDFADFIIYDFEFEDETDYVIFLHKLNEDGTLTTMTNDPF